MRLIINHEDYTAAILQQYEAPQDPISSLSQGSMQPLPSGNTFIGWGITPEISEHLEDGTPVFYLSLPGGSSYRSFKSKWKGHPTNPPDLWAYARDTTATSSTTVYMSWNGATDVVAWQVYVSTSRQGPFRLAVRSSKQGFETIIRIPGQHGWSFAEAISADGLSLGNSSVVSTWVPPPALAALCDDLACPNAHLTVEECERNTIDSSDVPEGCEDTAETALDDAGLQLGQNFPTYRLGVLNQFWQLTIAAMAIILIVIVVVYTRRTT